MSEAQEPVALNFAELNDLIIKDIRSYRDIGDTHFAPKKYTRERIRGFLERPEANKKALREVSHYLMVTSSHYRRLIGYFGTMLTLDYMVIPTIVPDNINKKFINDYKKAVAWAENLNIKHEFGKITRILMAEDIYFGVEREAGESFMFQRLPSDYCQIIGMEDGTFTFAMDMSYFDQQESLLDNYPPQFKKMFNEYKSAKYANAKWQPVDPLIGCCFKFNEELSFPMPPFSGVFEEVLAIEEKKDLIQTADKLDNFKLLIQKIPYKKDPKSEKDFIISLPSVRIFHNNIKKALPQGIAIVSTPMDIKDISFERKTGSIERNSIAVEDSFFSSAGVSKLLFGSASTGSIGLNRSIQADSAFVFPLLDQYQRYLRKRAKERFSAKQYGFKIVLPKITVYNQEEMFKTYLQASQFGFPRMMVAPILGYTNYDLDTMCRFENEVLNLKEKMIPLRSSHTQTGTGETGRPKESESNVSDETLRGQDNETSENRAE